MSSVSCVESKHEECGDGECPCNCHMSVAWVPLRKRGTRGKGRKITYWEDKAGNPPTLCEECKTKIVDGACPKCDIFEGKPT